MPDHLGAKMVVVTGTVVLCEVYQIMEVTLCLLLDLVAAQGTDLFVFVRLVHG